jgi:hypothetical protein
MNWRTYVSTVLGITGLIAAAIYLGGTNPKTGFPDPITVDGVTHTFTYTDSSEKENLRIYTDRETYTNGFSHATLYLAVVNDSGVGQDIELLGYFADDKRRITDIAVLSELTEKRHEPVFTEQCEDIATTTEQGQASTTKVCTNVQTATTTTQITYNAWVPLQTRERTVQERLKESMQLASAVGIERKTTGAYDAARKSTPFFVPSGGVVYYKVGVAFPPNGQTNMIIEAIGSAGGYGFLD